ncbi:TIGR03086 family protein [Actinoplanes hulinensis]|uniref:TIGR03086 family protein n=1 Tax=Actinoplanes hulinensis TaxID=1144547 RepID=A0ABS7B847_9ACTN|nr:TIGR03086 family metal-binding protein [Actinoplanes hulinensis]MBW6437234.1 TIGR03086 family protein [Actinoplanes hulinensis]
MHIVFAELLELDRAAVQHSLDLLTPVTTADLTRPTPCEGWTLGDLIAHMTAQHHGFAAAATGHGADPASWRVQPHGPEPVTAYRKAADEVLAAFPAAEHIPFANPEFGAGTFPATLGVGFHLVDYLVHSWDVAISLNVPFHPGDTLVAAALPIALAVPDGDQRLSPTYPFRPAIPGFTDAAPFDQLLAALGRNP